VADFYTNVGTGIKTLFGTSNTFHTAMTGGLWYSESKPDNDFPYCVYSFLGDKPMYWMADANPDEGEDILCQFTIFDKSSSPININKYEDYLRTLYDWSAVSVTGYTLMEMRRDNTVPAFRIDDIWQTTITYRIKIDKT